MTITEARRALAVARDWETTTGQVRGTRQEYGIAEHPDHVVLYPGTPAVIAEPDARKVSVLHSSNGAPIVLTYAEALTLAAQLVAAATDLGPKEA